MNEVYVIRRPPTDFLTYDLFHELVKDWQEDCEAYYIWTDRPEYFYNFCQYRGFTKPVVVIAVKDLLDNLYQFNWWHNERQPGCNALINLVDNHPDQQFVIFTSFENLNLEINHPRIQLIPYGGDIVNQHTAYVDVAPVIDKTSSDKHVLCLNRMDRDHRVVMLSYLYGQDLIKHCHATFLGLKLLTDEKRLSIAHFLDRIPWEFDGHHESRRETLFQGYQQMLSDQSLYTSKHDIYGLSPNNNLGNFESNLRPYYQNSLVEIVNETTFDPRAFMLTEKTLHSFYGCVFPIILSGAGAIAHLRELGFDMFDDIVDHSYDLINNPYDRLFAAVDCNKELITNPKHTKILWDQCRNRFVSNVDVAKNIYNWYESRTRKKWRDFCHTRL